MAVRPQKIDDKTWERLERLRVLSEPRPPEDVERMQEILEQSRMIAQIFRVHNAIDLEKKRKTEEEEKSMSFEEKRRLFEAEYPNKVSPEQSARTRERLKYIANNPELLSIYNPIAQSSSPEKSTPNIRKSWGWSTDSSLFSEESEANMTAPRVGKLTPTSESITFSIPSRGFTQESTSSASMKKSMEDVQSFSQMTYDAAYSASTQSQSLNPTINESQFSSSEQTTSTTCSG